MRDIELPTFQVGNSRHVNV